MGYLVCNRKNCIWDAAYTIAIKRVGSQTAGLGVNNVELKRIGFIIWKVFTCFSRILINYITCIKVHV